MAFEFCCFISYPHVQEEVLVPTVDYFVQGLKREIGAMDRRPLWFDQVLTGGRRIEEAIGAGLCKSACMIMLYTPLYFDEEHVYCARELKAMQDLEEERLRTLQDKSFGLDRKSTRLNSSHLVISYAVFCLKKKNRYDKLT